MITSLANVSLLVRDYDEAIQWYTGKLGLELLMDGSMGGDYRFVTVESSGKAGCPSSYTSPRGAATRKPEATSIVCFSIATIVASRWRT